MAGVTATVFLVDFALVTLPFFDTLVLFSVEVEEAATGAAGLTVGAGVPCAAKEAPAIASVMVKPRIVEIVFVIVLSVLFLSKRFVFARFCL